MAGHSASATAYQHTLFFKCERSDLLPKIVLQKKHSQHQPIASSHDSLLHVWIPGLVQHALETVTPSQQSEHWQPMWAMSNTSAPYAINIQQCNQV